MSITGLGLRAAARELKISHVALLKAIKNGRVQKEPDGTFDVEKCRKGLAENSNIPKQQAARAQQIPLQDGRPADVQVNTLPDGQGATFMEAQRQLEWLKVEDRASDNARKRGELVAVGEINAFVAGMIIRARDIFLRIGPEQRDRLAQESDPTKCEEMVMAEVRRGLRELAEYR